MSLLQSAGGVCMQMCGLRLQDVFKVLIHYHSLLPWINTHVCSLGKNAAETIERERDGGAREGAMMIPCILSLFLFTYVTHMSNVEPRGAGITLTIRVQHTHRHPLPTNIKETVLRFPPHVLCGYAICVYVFNAGFLLALHILIVCGCHASFRVVLKTSACH